MKQLHKLLILSCLIPTLAACQQYEYPAFGELKEGEKYNVGILLPVTHNALDAATKGFKEKLNECGWEEGKNITYVTKNALGSSDDQRLMAKTLIASSDLTLGLGTGASQDLMSAQKNRGSKNPILFTAVTDPVNANLVKSMENTEGYITGASDAQPVDAQIRLIKECLPEASKVGIFYTQTESNSAVQAKQAKAEIEKAGMVATIKTCTAANDIQTSIASLVNQGVHAIYIPTDNNVAANMALVSKAVKGKKILIIAGEEGMLDAGGQITLSVSYTSLGRKTAELADKILKGEAKPNELPVITMTSEECEYVMNSTYLEEAGITLPETVKNKCRDVSEK